MAQAMLDKKTDGGKQTKARAWMFTANKDPAGMLVRMNSDYPPHGQAYYGVHICCQLERAPTTGHQHLQGVIVYDSPKDFHTVRRAFPGCYLKKVTRSLPTVIAYCTKEKSRTQGPYSLGDSRPDLYSRASNDALKRALYEGEGGNPEKK